MRWSFLVAVVALSATTSCARVDNGVIVPNSKPSRVTVSGAATNPVADSVISPDSVASPESVASVDENGPIDTGYSVDDDGPVESDYVAEELARSKADLSTVLTGEVRDSIIVAKINIGVDVLVYGPHTIVTVTGGTITEPLNPFCSRSAPNEIDCTYGENAETVQPLEVLESIILTIKPTDADVTVTATSRYTEPFNDTNFANNTKTLTFRI